MKKIKVLLCLMMLIYIYKPCVVYAYDFPTTLTITKSDGSLALQGTDDSNPNDYYWEYYDDGDCSQNRLYIVSDNLTVSGTDTSNEIYIMTNASQLTIKNLHLKGKACGFLLGSEGDPGELIVSGNNSIIHNYFDSPTYVIPLAFDGYSSKISGTGNLSIDENNDTPAICVTTGDIRINLSGVLTVDCPMHCITGIFLNNIYFDSNISKVVLRCSGEFGSYPATPSENIIYPYAEIFGSTNRDENESNMLPATFSDTNKYIEVGGSPAYSVLVRNITPPSITASQLFDLIGDTKFSGPDGIYLKEVGSSLVFYDSSDTQIGTVSNSITVTGNNPYTMSYTDTDGLIELKITTSENNTKITSVEVTSNSTHSNIKQGTYSVGGGGSSGGGSSDNGSSDSNYHVPNTGIR